MNETFKRIISVMLAVTMILGVMPLALAEEKGAVVDIKKTIAEINESVNFEADESVLSALGNQDSGEVVAMSTDAEETFISGIFTYTIDENGDAIIVGTDVQVIGNITVPATLDGIAVTTVDTEAFTDCDGITGITFSESIGTIAADMFSLKNLEFVRMSTETECENMSLPMGASEVTVGNTITTISWSKTDKTTTLNIGSEVTDFNDIYEIRSCYSLSLESINLSGSNTAFKVVDGVLYNNDVTTFYLYPIASNTTSYVMPDTVLFTYETVDYIDTLYYAYNLKEITIGKNFNIAFETVENYREFLKDYKDYSEEAILYVLPNLIFQLGDGASHTCLFPFAANLEAIKVSPEHEYLTSKDGVLCLKNDNYNVVLVYPGSKEGTITLGENDFVYSYAFLALQEGHEFVLTDGYFNNLRAVAKAMTDANGGEGTEEEYAEMVEYYYTQLFNQVFTSTYVSKFTVSESSELYCTDEYGVLYNKDKTELAKYPVASEVEFYEIPYGTTFSTDAFMGFSPLSFKLYYPENLTVHINDFELAGLPICKTVCTDVSPDTLYTTTNDEGEEVTLTYRELFEEYNAQVAEVREAIDSLISECDAMLESGEINEITYEFTIGLATIMMGGYMPEIVFCEGHEVIEPTPDIPDEPEIPDVPDIKDDAVMTTPTQTTINYGDSIVLHVDESKIPEGGYVKWTSSNSNFDMSVSADGKTCTISPDKSGATTITATIYDADGNAVSTDEQEMTSKAGFWQKIIAFFKSIFGLTKVIPQAFLPIQR